MFINLMFQKENSIYFCVFTEHNKFFNVGSKYVKKNTFNFPNVWNSVHHQAELQNQT